MSKPDELVKLLREGDTGAFNQLFGRYSQRLYAFGLKYLKSGPDAEELVQDVFLKIWRNRERLNEEKNFQSYLFTIAFNQIKKYFQNTSLYLEENLSGMTDQVDESPERSITYQSVLDQISTLLEKLPPKRQQIFNLSRFEGKSADEISKQLGISPKTVDNQVSEVIKYLKTQVEDYSPVVGLFFFLFLNN
jgi:RNA polymerase sigma-70 factor (ECF subfamily)